MAKPLIVGAHTSIAGGVVNAVSEAVEKGCDCFQIFARNPRGWTDRELSREEIRRFRDARERAALWPLAIHSVYLINLASQDAVVLDRSRAAFRQEIERSLELGADYLVVHPGNPKSATVEAGIRAAVESVRRSARGLKMKGLTILIENTAGQGSSIGWAFEQVAEIIAALDDFPAAVCLDTAHTFAAGYDISTEKGLRETCRAIESSFGFDRIKLVHCNDSKTGLGSRVDRHEHIGLGKIGAAAFRRLTHNLKFRRVPFILETPVDEVRGDEENLAVIRELSDSRKKNKVVK
ncbi:MAG: deoxyribonuclease IV [Acidobacteriota bacterium]